MPHRGATSVRALGRNKVTNWRSSEVAERAESDGNCPTMFKRLFLASASDSVN